MVQDLGCSGFVKRESERERERERETQREGERERVCMWIGRGFVDTQTPELLQSYYCYIRRLAVMLFSRELLRYMSQILGTAPCILQPAT